uniref:Uncharacterized protein n=1 Tax=Gossypium raimondii TaxID=29730 RepID=A0A0D2T409_GOSRA|nr:hypothetical protein B456_011G073100 [Gossypium raimondii]
MLTFTYRRPPSPLVSSLFFAKLEAFLFFWSDPTGRHPINSVLWSTNMVICRRSKILLITWENPFLIRPINGI